MCDDRNNDPFDGCFNCIIEEPVEAWDCPRDGGRCRAALCSDGLIARDEELCDDGALLLSVLLLLFLVDLFCAGVFI